jgi:hypothetical protein
MKKNDKNKCRFFYCCKILIILIIFLSEYLINKGSKKVIMKLRILKEAIKIYYILYDTEKHGYHQPKFTNQTKKIYDVKKQKNGICLCTIGKNENLYIREFVEYYYSLGINKIIIYDNNDLNGERFEYIIRDFIKKKFVDIIDIRGLSSMQIPIYNYCYQKNKELYDWIGFLDFDEYLFIKNISNIDYYFYNKTFKKCELIFFNWLIFNDNDLIKYDKRKLQDRFNTSSTFFQGKSFVRGGFNNLLIPSTMIPGINIHYFCDSKGNRIYPKSFVPDLKEIDPHAYIKHYYTKTVEEFCLKISKGHAHFHKNHFEYVDAIITRIKLFFMFNKVTPYKIQKLEKCSNINLREYKIT